MESNQYDELRAMEEAMKQLGDEPPEITVPADGHEQVEETPPTPVNEPAPEALSGGLSEVPELDEDAPLTVEGLLGFGDKPAAETPDEPTPEQAASGPAVVEEDQTGVDKRFAELSATVARLQEQNDLLVNQRLRGDAEQPKEGDGQESPDLNPEVAEYLKPYVDAQSKAQNEEFERLVAPLRQQEADKTLAEGIGQYVDGFKTEHLPILRKELAGMSETDQAKYGVEFVGAVALANALTSSGALDLGNKPKKPTRNLSRRHHSEAAGAPPAIVDEMSEAQKIKRLNNVSNADIRRLVDGIGE